MTLSFEWPKALGFTQASGALKARNEDFIVLERLPETPSGEGEHLWLDIEKNGQNTAWVARQLSKWAGLKPRDVSYAGLKDRLAITRQTYSIHLPGKTAPSPHLIHIDGVKVIGHARHNRKLKTGQLVGNHFKIRIRNCDANKDQIKTDWDRLCLTGVPNYFGPQRFGHNGQNVQTGIDWLLGRTKPQRHHQSIYLSAVRSYLFNQILAARVKDGSWNQLIHNDFAQFTEGKAGFYMKVPQEDDLTRCNAGQISPSASLIGLSKDDYPELDLRERALVTEFSDVVEALESRKVMRHFRKLRVIPENPTFEVVDNDPVFGFFLPAGSFATSVLTELIDWEAIAVGDMNE
jgi:tRNA pseudouridine13 synthase